MINQLTTLFFVVCIFVSTAFPHPVYPLYSDIDDFSYPDSLGVDYFLIGALNEYQGRVIIELGDDRVESFYSNESDHSVVFRVYLERLKEKENISTELSTTTGEGGHIQFHSPELRQRLNTMYSYAFESTRGEYGLQDPKRNMTVRMTKAFASTDLFEPDDQYSKLSYLSGAYMRYGDGDTFHFANASHKVNLVSNLLMDLGCRNVKIESSPPDSIPRSSIIRFKPSLKVSEVFSQVTLELRNTLPQPGSSNNSGQSLRANLRRMAFTLEETN